MLRTRVLMVISHFEVDHLMHFRVRGTLAQIPRFSKAFGCQRGSPMRPRKLCPNVWKQRQPLVTPDSGEEGEE